MSLDAAKKELESAKRSLRRMADSKTFEEFEEHWKSVLFCLEKVWVKAEQGCKETSTHFQPWQGKYRKIRKRDPLLSYLKQARHADNHTIQEMSRIEPGFTALKFANPNGGFIRKLVVQNGKIMHYEGDDMLLTKHPPQIRANRIRNSGVWYEAPTTHLGRTVDTHPYQLAQCGIQFYEDFLKKAERKFYATSKNCASIGTP